MEPDNDKILSLLTTAQTTLQTVLKDLIDAGAPSSAMGLLTDSLRGLDQVLVDGGLPEWKPEIMPPLPDDTGWLDRYRGLPPASSSEGEQ